MRILYITLENISLHKGSVVHIKEVVRGLRELGHKIGLIALGWDQIDIAEHFYNLHLSRFFSQFRFKKQPFLISSLLLFLYLIRIIRRYDVIYARDFHTVIIAFFPRIIFKKKLVFEINGLANEEQRLKGNLIWNHILSFFIKKAEQLATKCSDHIVSVTSNIASYLINHFRCQPNKIEVVGNGVNTKLFRSVHDEISLQQWRKKLEIEKGEILIAFVGNLAPWQGVNILIESAFRLLNEDKNLKFLIIGDGLLKPLLMNKVLNSGYNEKFIFTGMIDYEDIPMLINIADICVAPFISKRNQDTGVSPLKVFEYMACGKPVVASRVEGLELIEKEGTGRLTEPEDVIGLEKTLYDLIKDSQERINMGQRGHQLALERFSWDSKVSEIERILKKIA